MMNETESGIFHLENSIRYYKKLLAGDTISKSEREIAKKYLKGYQTQLDLLILKQK